MNREDDELAVQKRVETGGGAYVGGSVDTGGGAFVGRDQVNVNIAADQGYDVSHLRNPYLGLSPFTYDDRLSYAGREQLIDDAVRRLTSDGAEQALLFLVGASGSGKSSLALAGILPALERYYAALRMPTQHIEFRAGPHPMSALIKRLPVLELQLSASDDPVLERTVMPLRQLSLLVIDQAEELFTQSEPKERETFIKLLEHLPPFADLSAHIIVTIRSDYLGELFHYSALYDLAKQGLDVRAMNENDLRASIQRPLEAAAEQDPSYLGKAWEPALVTALARQAAPSASYLPLLQLTLQELWRRGRLTLAAYLEAGSTLTSAIADRATTVLEYADYDHSPALVQRPEGDCEEIIRVLLDLIHVEPASGSGRPDARRSRRLDALVGPEGTATAATRSRLIEDMVKARLLSIGNQGDSSYVEIIHESLITNWDRLQQAIAAERQMLEKRTRFEQAVADWRNKVGDLLTGVRLAEARTLEERDDIALRDPEAREFLQQSKARSEADLEQRRLVERQQLADTLRREADEVVKLLPAQPLEALVRAVRAAGLNLDAAPDELMPELQLNLHAAVQGAKELRVYRGHSAPVRAVALSPLGRIVVSGGDDRSVRLWDVQGSQQLSMVEGGQDVVTAVAFSPDGKLISTGSADRKLRLWTENGRLLRPPFAGHRDAITAVVFRPQAEMLASASDDGTVRLWDWAGSQLACIHAHQGSVTAVVFSPNGQMLASAGIDGKVRLWDLRGRSLGRPFEADEDFVAALAFHPGGGMLTSAGGGGVIRVWDLRGRELCAPFEGHEGFVNAMAFPRNDFLVSAGDDRTLRLWDPGGGQIGDPLYGHSDGVTSLSVAADGTIIASGSRDGTVRLWEWRPISDRTAERIEPARAELAPQAELLPPRGTYLWDAQGDQWGPAWRGDPAFIRALAVTGDSQIVTGGGDRGVHVWNLGGLPAARMEGHTGTVTAVALSPDGHTIASGSRDSSVRLWNVRGEPIGKPFEGHKEDVNAVAFAPDGKSVVSGGNDCTLVLWDLEGRRIAGPFTAHEDYISAVAFSCHGEIVSGSGDGTLLLWDSAGQRVAGPFRGHDGAVSTVAFSPDGKLVVSGGVDGTVRLWHLDGTPATAPWRGHIASVEVVAFSRKGDIVLSASRDGSLRLRDLHGALVARPLRTRRGGLLAASFDSDGRLIVTGGSDGMLRVWRTGTWKDWLTAACRRLSDHPAFGGVESTVGEMCAQHGWAGASRPAEGPGL